MNISPASEFTANLLSWMPVINWGLLAILGVSALLSVHAYYLFINATAAQERQAIFKEVRWRRIVLFSASILLWISMLVTIIAQSVRFNDINYYDAWNDLVSESGGIPVDPYAEVIPYPWDGSQGMLIGVLCFYLFLLTLVVFLVSQYPAWRSFEDLLKETADERIQARKNRSLVRR